MLRNYFRTAIRNLQKNKIYSFINIAGLAAGMAVAIMIGLWIADEISFDRYHKNYKLIAQVMRTTSSGKSSANMAIPLAEELKVADGNQFKSISLASRSSGLIISANEKKIRSTGIWAEPALAEMLTLQMIHGSSKAMADPSSTLISASLSKTVFGDEDPTGRIIRIDNKSDLKVGGVFEDLPLNTSFHEVKIIAPWARYITVDEEAKFNRDRWGNHNWQIYAQMQSADISKINAAIRNIANQHLDIAEQGKEEIFIHPMKDWHLRNEFQNGQITGGKIRYLWLFGIIGSFVLLLACINFVNLSTARSEKRAKEVGVRKAVGSVRSQLIGQFLLESVLTSTLGFIIAIAICRMVMPGFNQLSGKDIQMPWTSFAFWISSVGFTVFTGLVSGIYPAFYLSRFNPVKVLKGVFTSGGRLAALPRKTLVVMQFTISITLIIATIIVVRQIQMGRNRPVGFNREGLITIQMNTPELHGHYNALRNDLMRTGVIANMAESSSPATDVWSHLTGFEWRGMDPRSIPALATIAVTHDYGKTIGWTLTGGRDFSRSFPTDSGAFILNEAAAKFTGFKNPVGEVIRWEGQDHRILGVVKDMVMESPYALIKPTVYFLEYNWARVITIRIKPQNSLSDALAKIETVFRRINPESPFDFQFADSEYGAKFSDDLRISHIAMIFAGLAIFISCLGLFGLSSFIAEQRFKEIGIRKVLGASVFGLWRLLSRDFIILTAIACCISIPLSAGFLNHWLQQFEYRTTIPLWIFAASSLGAIFIALVTVSFQSVRAARANPVKNLRPD